MYYPTNGSAIMFRSLSYRDMLERKHHGQGSPQWKLPQRDMIDTAENHHWPEHQVPSFDQPINKSSDRGLLIIACCAWKRHIRKGGVCNQQHAGRQSVMEG
jgi:hypothetical protein